MSSERVLIVDDDRTLASMIEEELTKAGFDCVRATTDRAAQGALSGGRPFDILVTDVNLGEGVTGFDLGRLARRSQPGIRIIYMSGEANAHHWMSFGEPDSDYISKPFTLEKLTALVLRGRTVRQPSAAGRGTD